MACNRLDENGNRLPSPHGEASANVSAELRQQEPDRLITLAHGHFLLKPI